MTGIAADESLTVIQPAAPDPNEQIQLDDTASNSDYEDGASTASASLTSSILHYTYENGRRYHAYREGEYVLPNDEVEQDRLDLHHHIFRLTLNGELFRAPISRNPHRVLDFGCGTGMWAMDFADLFPSAEVIGTDLSPIQPSWVPQNCRFYVDDVESEWPHRPDEEFDFIHGRGMGGSIKDWDRLYQQIYTNLKPGGWVEMQEYEGWCTSDDDTLNNAPSVYKWQSLINEASIKFGKKVNEAATHKQRLIDAGFVDVQDDVYKVPIGVWPKDRKMKELGRYQLEQMCLAVESFALALFTRVLGWSHEECQVLIAGARSDFKNRDNHLYANFHFVYGRKPLS